MAISPHDSLGFSIQRCEFEIPCRWDLDSGFQMNKGPQTNMPENEESKEDLISKKIPGSHIAICTADRITSKLTLKDINTTPI